MSIERNNLKDKSASNGQVVSLDENELESVSGGLFGITIIDTCQQKYDYNHCCNNFGNCPQLDVIGEYIGLVNGRKVRTISCSCNKGYFQFITDTHNI
jgi:hypothetical protein